MSTKVINLEHSEQETEFASDPLGSYFNAAVLEKETREGDSDYSETGNRGDEVPDWEEGEFQRWTFGGGPVSIAALTKGYFSPGHLQARVADPRTDLGVVPQMLRFPIVLPDPSIDRLASSISRITLPRRWIEEGVQPPTLECRQKATRICTEIFEKFRLHPDFIAPSKEEGLFFVYRHPKSDRSLSMEIDNELDCLGQVYDSGEIYLTEFIETPRVISALVAAFNEF